MGTGLWLSHPGTDLLLEFQEENPHAPKERYFFPILCFSSSTKRHSAQFPFPVLSDMGMLLELNPWEAGTSAQPVGPVGSGVLEEG